MPAERLSIAVSESCAQTIRKLAEQNKTTVSAQIRTALKAYVNGMILDKMEDAVVAAYNAKVASLEQRLTDKDEIIKSKDDLIEGLRLVIKLDHPEREPVIFTEDGEDISKNG